MSEQPSANPSDDREAEALASALIEAILNKHHMAIVSELRVQVAIDALGREPGESLVEWEARARIARDYLRGKRS